ncbi:EF-hand calcium-binding domain-containing protein 4B-like isoform X2 [Littorina saxatilis]
MEEMMLTKATELFRLCDTEEKGFITKRDMQRLRSELPISPDQLEIVFDSLDHDRNGFLTLDEFTEGFGSFLGMKPRQGANGNGGGRMEDEEGGVVFEGEAGDGEDSEKVFDDVMMHIDARGVFQDEDVVKAMWMKLHKDEPDLVGTFEDFISKTATEIKRSRGEFHTLEGVLKSKTNEHEEEVKKLYEEMEFQMKREQERILAEEKAKERQLRDEMESALQEKERQLMEMQNRHQEMEEKLAHLNLSETNTKQENQRLAQEKEQLEEMLEQSQDSLEESRSYISLMQSQQKDDKKERAMMVERSGKSDRNRSSLACEGVKHKDKHPAPGKPRAALKLSEGIAMERETLVKQLDLLKDVNKKLLDDKDEAEAIEARRDDSIQGEVAASLTALAQQTEEPQNKRNKLVKQGSLLSKYFPGGPAPTRQRSETLSEDLEDVEDIDADDDIEMDDLTGAQIYTFGGKHHGHAGTAVQAGVAMATLHSAADASTAKNSYGGGAKGRGMKGSHSPDFGRLMREDSYTSDAESEAVVKNTGQLGSQTESMGMGDDMDGQTEAEPPAKLKRIFKVVFVGDSGVGKSSFIFRFCNDTFKASFSATIGVDFQVKPLVVGDSIVVLQLWDTAGQERYRSVTKQYFRKADGVILMYDVTSEQSFLNIRQWMDSVQQGVEEGTVLCIIGNKMDIFESDPEHATKVKDGSKLAVEYDALFYETSAKTGSYVTEAMLGMASLLQDKEDKAIEASLHLEDAPKKKKGCCK